jgi:hypothetical protein
MIVGGTVRVMKRDSDRESVMSTFGQDLLYINVGFADKLKDEIEPDTNPLNTLLVTIGWSVLCSTKLRRSVSCNQTFFTTRLRTVAYKITTKFF